MCLGHICAISLLREYVLSLLDGYCGEDKPQSSVVCAVLLKKIPVLIVFKQTISWKTTREIKTDLSNVKRFIVVPTCSYKNHFSLVTYVTWMNVC